jgi:agmatinase
MPLRLDPQGFEQGLATFIRAPIGDIEDLQEGMVAVAGVPFDLAGTGRAGARIGPRVIREASLRYSMMVALDSVDPNTQVRLHVPDGDLRGKVLDLGDTNSYPVDWHKMEMHLRRSMYEVARRGALPIFLGGDHLISYPLVLGFRDAMAERDRGKVGYIQFSSQLDLGDEDPLWGRVWRGATARRILESGAVSRRNMVYVGANGYLPRDQVALAEELDFKVFTLGDVEREGMEKVTREALERAGEGCGAVYVSMDADVIDGAYLQSASDHRFQGVTVPELEHAMNIIAESKAGALDIVGCNPTLEFGGEGRTATQWAAWMAFRFMMPRL